MGDSPDELRKRVREQRKYGAEAIKVCATGGVFSRNTAPGVQQLREEELRAVAEEAHFWKLKTAAHAHGATRSELSTDSRTGALGLYERVGMEVTSTWVHRAIHLP